MLVLARISLNSPFPTRFCPSYAPAGSIPFSDTVGVPTSIERQHEVVFKHEYRFGKIFLPELRENNRAGRGKVVYIRSPRPLLMSRLFILGLRCSRRCYGLRDDELFMPPFLDTSLFLQLQLTCDAYYTISTCCWIFLLSQMDTLEYRIQQNRILESIRVTSIRPASPDRSYHPGRPLIPRWVNPSFIFSRSTPACTYIAASSG